MKVLKLNLGLEENTYSNIYNSDKRWTKKHFKLQDPLRAGKGFLL